MHNVHINMNEFTNASRVLKQVKSLIKAEVFKKITIIALGSKELPKHEHIAQDIETIKVTKKAPVQIAVAEEIKKPENNSLV